MLLCGTAATAVAAQAALLLLFTSSSDCSGIVISTAAHQHGYCAVLAVHLQCY
jgi:hypothetical protein